MKRRLAGLSLAVLAGIGASTATAQVASPQPRGEQGQTTPTPAALALSKRYLKVIEIEKQLDMITAMVRGGLTSNAPAGVSSTELKTINDAVDRAFRTVSPVLVDRAAVVQARVFSEAELNALVDFYEAPVGRSIVAKMPLMGPGMAELMAELLPMMQAETAKELCAALPASASCKSMRAAPSA